MKSLDKMTKIELIEECKKLENEKEILENDLDYANETITELEDEICDKEAEKDSDFDKFIKYLRLNGLYTEQIDNILDDFFKFYLE